MFFDLNVPIPALNLPPPPKKSKGKGKQQQQAQSAEAATSTIIYPPALLTDIEARINLLVQLGYTAIALNQVIRSKFDPSTHVDLITPLRKQLRPRGPGLIILSRLTIILDTESEHGTGLTAANVSQLSPYDILAVMPTTQNTFSAACLTHSLPSQMTTHVIALPLMLGTQLPIKMKHTLVRTAIRNGAVFEISYAGALGGVDEMGEGGAAAKRNWWTAAREVARATKGKGLIVSGGAGSELELRGPKDVNNLVTLLGLAQNLGHDALTKTPKSLALRASTRKTYRAIFSAPKLVVPSSDSDSSDDEAGDGQVEDKTIGQVAIDTRDPLTNTMHQGMSAPPPATMLEPPLVSVSQDHPTSPRSSGQKRGREEAKTDESGAHGRTNVEGYSRPAGDSSSKVHVGKTMPVVEPKQKKQKKNKK